MATRYVLRKHYPTSGPTDEVLDEPPTETFLERINDPGFTRAFYGTRHTRVEIVEVVTTETVVAASNPAEG